MDIEKCGSDVICMFKEIKKEFTPKTSALAWFGMSLFFLWVLSQLLYLFYDFSILSWIRNLPLISPFLKYFVINIQNRSPLNIVLSYLISTLFFFPFPMEAIYLKYLNYGHYALYDLMFLAILGTFIGQVINYNIGKYLGHRCKNLVSKRTRTWIKNNLTKYEGIAIVIVGSLPLPSQMFNLFVGFFDYDATKFKLYCLTGIIIKFIILTIIFINF